MKTILATAVIVAVALVPFALEARTLAKRPVVVQEASQARLHAHSGTTAYTCASNAYRSMACTK